MKTNLPKRSLVIKDRLDRIVETILAGSKHELAMIILFGSYARGTWVVDSYVEGHTTYSYQSDLDIMLVTKSPKYGGIKGRSFGDGIKRRLERSGLGGRPFLAPSVTIITETIKHVNEKLEKSQYFFSDIKKEGILLYDSGEFKLSEARDLSWEERKEIAQDYYDQWFPDGCVFLDDSYLLVFSGYKEKEHDIEKLGSLASNYSDELLKIFPRDTDEHNRLFILLKEAYIRARYDKTYKITEEELLYLIQRVEKLKAVTEEICQTWINQPLISS
jgi:hypothetical protein